MDVVVVEVEVEVRPRRRRQLAAGGEDVRLQRRDAAREGVIEQLVLHAACCQPADAADARGDLRRDETGSLRDYSLGTMR